MLTGYNQKPIMCAVPKQYGRKITIFYRFIRQLQADTHAQYSYQKKLTVKTLYLTKINPLHHD